MYDAIIVGTRCAGAPLAMRLARAGYRVLAVDRATFPSDTVSTHALTGDSVWRLSKWGLLDRVLATGCPQFSHTQFFSDGQRFELGHFPGFPQVNPRRTVLDAILVEAARAAGAEVREGFAVTGLVRGEDGAVQGVEGQDSDGMAVREEARVVVGADGRHSLVAKLVGAAEYNELPADTCGYFSYFEGFPAETSELHFTPGRMIFAFPTNDGVCVGAEFRLEEFEQLGGLEDAMADTFARVPGFPERVAQAKRMEKWHGASRMQNVYRVPSGPGWALVGDAGYTKDPVLGQGINDAFRDADALADALDAAWQGRQPVAEALAGYQQQRDAATAQVYQLNHLFSRLNVTPDLVQMLVMAASQAQAVAHPA